MGFSGARDVRGKPLGLGAAIDVSATESAIGRFAESTERRDIMTTIATLAAAQNGTSGVLTVGKRTRIPGDVKRPGPRGDLGLIER